MQQLYHKTAILWDGFHAFANDRAAASAAKTASSESHGISSAQAVTSAVSRTMSV